MTCTFFGHIETPKAIKDDLRNAIIDAIEKYKIDRFYVGYQGGFDNMAISILGELKEKYDYEYYVVLAYFMGKQPLYWKEEHPTVYPEGQEKVLPRFAISHRNKWMVKNSDMVIAYIGHDYGGAVKFVKSAASKGKRIINLGQIDTKTLRGKIKP